MRLQQRGAGQGLGAPPHPAEDGPGARLLGGQEAGRRGHGGAEEGRDGARGGGAGGPARRGEAGRVGEGFCEGSCVFVSGRFLGGTRAHGESEF